MGCLGEKADLAHRDVILAPTAGEKQFSGVFNTAIPKGLRSETSHEHMVRDSCSPCCPNQVKHRKQQTQGSNVAFLSQSQPDEGPCFETVRREN